MWMSLMQKRLALLCLLFWGAFMLPGNALAHDGGDPQDNPLEDVAYRQRLDALVPLELSFLDENGSAVQLEQYFADKPVLLVLAYYECPQLCSVVLNELTTKLSRISFDAGEQFEVVVVSIDPGETPQIASQAKSTHLAEYGRPETAGGWHFLTGKHEAIDRLADAVGFEYTYVPERDEYAHPTGVVVLTPRGRISRYFFGLEYPPGDLRLGMVEASSGKIASPVDQFVLSCYAYDPVTGRYSLIIHRALQIGGAGAVLALTGMVVLLLWNERRKTPPVPRAVVDGKELGLQKSTSHRGDV